MTLHQVVWFLHLSLAHFRPEMLVLIGDELTLPLLRRIHQDLNVPLLPIVIITTLSKPPSAGAGPANTVHQRDDFPTRRLTCICLSTYINIALGKLLANKYQNVYPMVVLSVQPNSPLMRMYLATIFLSCNVVLVEFGAPPSSTSTATKNIQVFAWGTSILRSWISQYDGAEAIFRAHNDTNALVYRRQLLRFAGAVPATATLFTTMMAPYNFLLANAAAPGGSKPLLLASSALTLFQHIGHMLHFHVRMFFNEERACAACFEAMPTAAVTAQRDDQQLYDYEQRSLNGRK